MALSTSIRRRLAVALANSGAANAIADAIDGGGSPTANIAALAASTNIPAAATAGGATPTAANVNTAIDTATAVIETRLDAIESKINTLLAALKASGAMIAD